MSNRKTKVALNQVSSFLSQNFSDAISEIVPLEGGELSSAFSFVSNDEAYVIRIDREDKTYKKDDYVWQHFISEDVQVPEIVKLGTFNEKNYFAISKKCPGKTLDKFSYSETNRVLPAIIKTLDAIHSIDISNTNGYGVWQEWGEAPYKSWKEYISAVADQNQEWNKNPVIEYIEILKKINNKILSLIDYCPEERYLYHGDFGFNNALAENDAITGVLDWGESGYGDFVFDIAWLDVWQDAISYEEVFANHYKEIAKVIPHYSERILCYKMFVYYGSIIFFVQTNQSEEAKVLIKKIETQL